jgi:hypothetical protein
MTAYEIAVRLEYDLRMAERLVRLLTVKQVLDAGYDAIEAAGLDPWCVDSSE